MKTLISTALALAALAAPAGASAPTTVDCHRAHARYVQYEDGSGVLFCGRAVLVRVHVPR